VVQKLSVRKTTPARKTKKATARKAEAKTQEKLSADELLLKAWQKTYENRHRRLS
jgi:hypothetical protein